MDEAYSKPAKALLGPIEKAVSELALRFNKKIEFEIKGGSQLIHVNRYYEVMENLIHLIRNAVVHGIETPDARGSKEKVGHISLQFFNRQGGFVTWLL